MSDKRIENTQSAAAMPASHSSTTLTEDMASHSHPQQASPANPSPLQNSHLFTLSKSASNASFNTSSTLSPTPTQPPANKPRITLLKNAHGDANPNAAADESSMFSSIGHHPTSTNPLFLRGPWFKDSTGRTVTLRGVNLSGASKMPVNSPSHRADCFLDEDGQQVSFIGRPFPLEEADEHLARLQHWGFNLLRFIVTWEAIEHAGPGKYDYDYFDYLVKVFHKCKRYGFKCFIDPHQDVWSRFSGGSGAPLWTLYLAGLDPSCFPQTNAALVHNQYDDPENFPRMVWATNYNRLAAATMFTLFFAGATFAPYCTIDQMNIQDYLQTHYIKSYMALARYITEQNGIEDDVVIGYDTLNEPSAGWIGVEDLTKIPQHQELKKDTTPTPLQAMILGQGFQQTVEFWVSTFFGPRRKGSKTVNPQGVTAWLTKEKRDEKDKKFGWSRASFYPRAGECIWAAHGVWDIASQQVLNPTYFNKNPETGEKYDFDARSFLPFCRRFAQAVRSVHKAAIIFLEPPVNEIPPSLPPPHDDDDVAQFDITSRVVYAPHWYDGLTLLNKKWNFFNIDYLGVKRGRYPNYAAAIKIGEKAIKECFRHQLACIKEEGQAAIGQHPTLIGEIGIPYDMNGAKAYKPNGNYKQQIKAMDANLYALDHKWGDLWNGEDLSLWSKDDICRDSRTKTMPLRKKPSVNSLAGIDGASSDQFSLHRVDSGCNTPRGGTAITIQDSPESTPGLTRRSSSTASLRAALEEPSQVSQSAQSPVHARVAKLSSSPPISSSSSTRSESTAGSDRPLLQSPGSSYVHSSTESYQDPHATQQGLNPNLGGRAVVAFCRPFAQKVAGEPIDLSFSLSTVVFKFSFRRTRTYEPTEIYLPRIHFPCADEYFNSLGQDSRLMGRGQGRVCSVTVSGGRWEWKEEEQILYWWTNDEDEDEDEDNDDEDEEDRGNTGRRARGFKDNDNKRQTGGKEDVYEIVVVGKKWTGNSLNASSRAGGLWNTLSQCCRIS
ncbi:hypothetical protein BGW38_005298 [Lunasporangiospora selenospora]|uniref:Uncharacterized protein n=1 Tax=Lunasporangiospora selenospora TaxID=979761 RepID=A0A9P6KHG0_9FUNG|nr:hypothetical protein BGW38_005298 [Lunasporangiospora selenospora]